jgi:tetratricopeptide (TPR) repeat protein
VSATSPPPASSSLLAGQLVVLTGKLASLGHKEARALVERLGGSTADDVSARTTMLVMGALGEEGAGEEAERDGDSQDGSAQTRAKSLKLRRAEELNAQQSASIQILSEDAFCRLVGVPAPTELRQQYHGVRDVLGRYRALREDHLRYLIKCGVVRPVLRNNADTYFTFQDLAVFKQANDELSQGASFRSVVKSLLATREGQLSFDFRLDAEPARIITLERRRSQASAPAKPQPTPTTMQRTHMAEEYFRVASTLDDGDPSTVVEAAAKYRKALALDPYLVAALINLANIHYSRDELIEAQALYEQAIGIEPDYFEAHFNLGNIHHDLSRFPEAQACYREALRLNPTYADAHFYLAVTFEKMGLSHDAKPHWTAYRQLAPKGEWVELAKEFSD